MRWNVALGLAIVAGVGIWLAVRRDPAAPATAVADPPTVRHVAPEPPRLAVPAEARIPEVALATLPANTELRDSTWAPVIEGELAHRLETVRGGERVVADCRTASCELTIRGSTPADVALTIADLETAHGLTGWASSLALTAPDRDATGVVVRAIVQFNR